MSYCWIFNVWKNLLLTNIWEPIQVGNDILVVVHSLDCTTLHNADVAYLDMEPLSNQHCCLCFFFLPMVVAPECVNCLASFSRDGLFIHTSSFSLHCVFRCDSLSNRTKCWRPNGTSWSSRALQLWETILSPFLRLTLTTSGGNLTA